MSAFHPVRTLAFAVRAAWTVRRSQAAYRCLEFVERITEVTPVDGVAGTIPFNPRTQVIPLILNGLHRFGGTAGGSTLLQSSEPKLLSNGFTVEALLPAMLGIRTGP